MKTVYVTLLATLLALSVACGYSAKSTAPVAGTIPAITQLAPDNMNAGSAAFVLTVNGTSFGSKAVVNFNGAAQTTTYVTASQITASIPASGDSSSRVLPIKKITGEIMNHNENFE